MGRKAPRQAPDTPRYVVSHGCLAQHPNVSRRPTPRSGVGEARMQTPGAETRRGNEEVCVLEIVRPGMEDSESAEKQENTGTSSSCAGLTRASIFFAKCFYEDGWIVGSSPAMTARLSSPRKRGPMITAGGYGSRLSPRFREGRPGRHRLVRAEHQPPGVQNGGRAISIVSD